MGFLQFGGSCRNGRGREIGSIGALSEIGLPLRLGYGRAAGLLQAHGGHWQSAHDPTLAKIEFAELAVGIGKLISDWE